MIRIPIGKAFEAFIDWLKTTFDAVFDFIADILDWVITFLEDIFLFEHAQVFPAIVIISLIGLVVFLLLRGPHHRSKLALPLAVAVILLLAVLEVLRYSSLEDRLTVDQAGEIAAEFADAARTLEQAAPKDYSNAIEVLQTGLASLPDSDETPWPELRDAYQDTVDEVEDTRPERYENVADELADLQAEIAALGPDIDSSHRAQLEETRRYFAAFEAIEELRDIEEEFADLEEAERRVEIFNPRTYGRAVSALALASTLEAPDTPVPGARGAAAHSLRTLRAFNPESLAWYRWVVVLALFFLTAWLVAGPGVAAFTLLGFLLIVSMGLWVQTIETLALVFAATFFAVAIGVPLGIWAARSDVFDNITRPVLDLMQTMPAFVYLIPAVVFFGLGVVPGAIATLIFSMPPSVRLTNLGIRQVPTEVVEACLAFGATPRQLLLKAQLPIAIQTILAGLNQTIMLALSMVVIAGMIGAGGLGQVVLEGITQLKMDIGFEGGLAVVILAIFLDRLTQALGRPPKPQ